MFIVHLVSKLKRNLQLILFHFRMQGFFFFNCSGFCEIFYAIFVMIEGFGIEEFFSELQNHSIPAGGTDLHSCLRI